MTFDYKQSKKRPSEQSDPYYFDFKTQDSHLKQYYCNAKLLSLPNKAGFDMIYIKVFNNKNETNPRNHAHICQLQMDNSYRTLCAVHKKAERYSIMNPNGEKMCEHCLSRAARIGIKFPSRNRRLDDLTE